MLLFILVLLIAGGAIAYMGDRLGTYIGKKRLSRWGLRPRHTAMLYTVVFGSLIAVLTLFALIAFDRTVQVALLRGPELLEQNHHLKYENRAQGALIHSRETQVKIADARAVAALAQMQTAEAQKRQAAREARAYFQKALDAEGTLGRVLGRLTAARADVVRSQGELRQRQAQLSAAHRRLADVNHSLGGTRADLRTARIHLRTAQVAAAEAEAGVRKAQHRYDLTLTTVAELARKGTDLTGRNAELSRQNAELGAKNQQLLTQTTFLQGGHLVYHKGQEIGRRVIPTDASPDTVRQSLLAFLADLSDTAAHAGAAPGDNGRAVQVSAVTADGQAVSEDDALGSLAQLIAQQAGTRPDIVLVVTARFNSFGGEPVQVQIQPFDYVLVFSQGTVIASDVIDGSLPEDQILAALQTFLKERVGTAARQQGVIPRPDPDTGEPTVGERTDSAKTLALVKQIQRIGPGALVVARAAADAYSSGPLRLDLTASAPPPVVPPDPSAAGPPVVRRGGL